MSIFKNFEVANFVRQIYKSEKKYLSFLRV